MCYLSRAIMLMRQITLFTISFPLIVQEKKPLLNTLKCCIAAGLIVMIGACSGGKSELKKNAEQSNAIIPAPHITILADLPDSNKPEQIFIKKAPFSQRSALPVIHYLEDKLTRVPLAQEAQGKGLFTSYTTDNGIGLDEVYCSFKDRSGILWFGTNGGGITRYDGKTFTNYTTANGLAYNLIWCITQDKKNNLWIGTDGGGVSKYDGKGFTNFTTSQGLAHNVVYSVKEDKSGNLWFGRSACRRDRNSADARPRGVRNFHFGCTDLYRRSSRHRRYKKSAFYIDCVASRRPARYLFCFLGIRNA